MSAVDGTTTQPDSRGVTQGNGGNTDLISGTSGNDALYGHAEHNKLYGGAGNDAFVLNAKFGELTDASTKSYDHLAAYIQDFHGAGGYSAGENDFISLTGFHAAAGTQPTLIGSVASPSGGSAVVYYYSVETDTHQFYNFAVNSLNGKALAAGDFNFYG